MEINERDHAAVAYALLDALDAEQTGAPFTPEGQATADQVATLAIRMLARMHENQPERGDWRADNPARAAMRSHILRAAADKLVRLFCQAFDGHDRDGLVEAIEEQAADVANWAWLLARAAIDAAERRKG